MDFYRIGEKKGRSKDDPMRLYPRFIIQHSKDLMVRGRSFYAIWNEATQLWSTNEFDVTRLVDEDLRKKSQETGLAIDSMADFGSNTWLNWRTFINNMPDCFNTLDDNLTFSNTQVKKSDFVSKRLSYPLEEGDCPAYHEIMETLYDPEERAKLEWAIGAIVAGEAKYIQKFIVLYGEAGSGKSTVLNIIEKLFEGYYTMFDAKALAGSSNTFSTDVFRANPLIAIQHDGDLSKIEDNTKLNSIIAHENMSMNEKNKPSYVARTNCFLFMGTNKPVKITDAKSGIIRRLINVAPSGRLVPTKKYHALMAQISFELGAIAWHCLQVYLRMGKHYYSSYRPLSMIYQTDVFFNFVETNYHIFKEQDGVTLSQAYTMYKAYCDEALVEFKMPRHKFREELRSYFQSFEERTRIEGAQVRSYYSGFRTERFTSLDDPVEEKPMSLVMENTESIFDKLFSASPAQYASDAETPKQKWDDVTTTLADIDTKRLHYVKPPDDHIVIDFDIRDNAGNKSLELNLEAASQWPATYSEYSKSGAGVHLHYVYDGDVSKLSHVYSEGIEIKVFTGKSSLRRQLTMCNAAPISTMKSGQLPLKGEKMVNLDVVKSEAGLRAMIARNLNKEFHQGTKPSIDFIYKILDDAYKSGMKYDVTDMRPKILVFANNSTNQADYCIKLVQKMAFASETPSEAREDYSSEELIFYDVEVFPNLFVVCWKAKGKGKVKMINPLPTEIEALLKLRLVGFNCRRYDNHILYGRLIGYSNEQLYELSQKIINGSKNAMFGEAYNLSYTDVFDFASAGNKMSLKKWEIKLGIHHQELGLPWDKPVPEELWDKVADYCCNDVDATEAVFDHLRGDWAARQILAALSGLSVNDTTNQHTTRIVFGKEKNPQSSFIYTDLSEMFPGYIFERGKSTYRGVETGEGGYVYAEPGAYTNVCVLDVASMHPNSIRNLNMFGPYTKNFTDLVDGRVAIKHEDYQTLEILLDGKLVPFIQDALGDNPRFTMKDVSSGLKTAINAAYGLTAAKFDNPFKDPRNKDNIVAKRGALFMVDLQYAVQEKGFKVAHIKTDSIKIPDATQEIIDFVFEFGRKYGYEFEHESTYEKFCLLNRAVYVASERINGEISWTSVGDQLIHPYTFKTLFSKKPLEFRDYIEPKMVTTALYLDLDEDLGEDEHNYVFVGKAGAFCPIRPGCGGGRLLREKDGKYSAAEGTKGYRWLEAEMIQTNGWEDRIDLEYYNGLVDAAVADISKHVDFEWFRSEEPIPRPGEPDDRPPWCDGGCQHGCNKNCSNCTRAA